MEKAKGQASRITPFKPSGILNGYALEKRASINLVSYQTDLDGELVVWSGMFCIQLGADEWIVEMLLEGECAVYLIRAAWKSAEWRNGLGSGCHDSISSSEKK